VFTWNLAGRGPNPEMDIADIVLPHACYDVDLYIVGLQEMVDLSMIGSVTCKKDVQRVL
jgi:hypothetical protein